MINRLYIDGYKCYSNFEVNFGDKGIVFLAGENGAGKTTLFETLSLLKNIAVHGLLLSDKEGGDSLVMGKTATRWLKEVREQHFELDVELDGNRYQYSLVVDLARQTQTPRIQNELVCHEGQPIYRFAEGTVTLFNDRYEGKVEFNVAWSRSFLPSVAEREDNTKLIQFRKWLGGILNIKANPLDIASVAIQEVRQPSSDLGNFASWLRYLKQSADDESYERYRDDLMDCIPDLTGISFREMGDNAKELVVRMKDVKEPFRFAELSDGQKLLLAYYAVMHFAARESSVVCLDEPDNYLSLGELQPVIETLREQSGGDGATQFLVASHHPEFYRQFAMEDGYLLKRTGATPTRVLRMSEVLNATGLKMPVAEIVARGWED